MPSKGLSYLSPQKRNKVIGSRHAHEKADSPAPVEIPEHPAKKAEHSRDNRDDRLGGKSFYFKGEMQA